MGPNLNALKQADQATAWSNFDRAVSRHLSGDAEALKEASESFNTLAVSSAGDLLTTVARMFGRKVLQNADRLEAALAFRNSERASQPVTSADVTAPIVFPWEVK